MTETWKKLPQIDVDIPMPKTTPPRENSLPPWGSVKECPKCGEERDKECRETRPAENPLQWWGVTEITEVSGGFKYEYLSDTTGHPDAVGHMEVICPRCGHGWDEQTKDAGG